MIENPILRGFNPDPSIIRVGNTYYIAVSSFEWFPGIPIYKSYDLVNWKLCNHAVIKQTQADLTGVASAAGIWAPSLSWNKDLQKAYITYSIVRGFDNNNFDVDNYVIYSDDIEGEWSDAIYLNSSGFDPSLFHDNDGKSYLINLRWEFRYGYEHPGVIILQEFDTNKNVLIGDISIISKGATERGCLEGPNIYYKYGYYYLFTAEGGTGYGHCVALSRSKSVKGPYIPYERNPIITSQKDNFSERGVADSAKPWRYANGVYLQKAGHGSLVETPENQPYIVHLCSRPITSQHRCVLGRETAIQKCDWTNDGWVKMQGPDNIAKRYVYIDNREKQEPLKEKPFYSLRKSLGEKVRFCENNIIEMEGGASLFNRETPSLLAKKITSFNYNVQVEINAEPNDFLEMAGFVNYYNNNNFYYLRIYYNDSLKKRCLGIIKAENGIKHEFLESDVPLEDNWKWISLKAEVREEKLDYFYKVNDNWISIGDTMDSTILSDENANGFTGSFAGITVQDYNNKSFVAKFRNFVISDI